MARSGGPRRFPLLPVIAVLVLLSVLTHAPFWLLVFPLMFLRSRRGATQWGPNHWSGHGHTDYRRRR